MTFRDTTEWFGHPRGLFVLFLTEMWERFSYYGMRTLLVYYMMKQLTFSQGQASHIYGLYTGLVYFTPFLGGMLADRVLGQKRAVILGGVLMALGHFAMASEDLFFLALVLLILGNGFFKPNISTQVGSLYVAGDPRRDRAFSIFYVGINVGAFFSPIVCGTLGEVYGWHYGFASAGVGMMIGLSIYLAGHHWLPSGRIVDDPGEQRSAPESEHEAKNRALGLVAICLASVAFWAAYEQQGNTLALWADADTDRRVFGWEFPASWFQALNPLLIFLLTPALTKMWAHQSAKGKEPSAVSKMAIGCFLLAFSFVVLVPAALLNAEHGIPVSFLWLIFFSLFLTVGELYVSPIGLSLVTKLAPPRMVSMMMGVWFLSAFAGNYAAGFLGHYWEKLSKDLFFLLMSGVALAAGVAIVLIRKPLMRTIGCRLDL